MKRKQRKVLSLLLSLAMLCSLAMPTAFAADSRYTDTPDHWAETAINRWSDYGIIEGYGDAFNPDNSITRGQMATILSKTLGLTEEAENPFSDISAHEWYAPYVLRCYKAGIMLGNNGKANPDAEITRQEAMTMFCRAFGIKAEETANLASFKDSGAIADWALPYVSALINGGIVSGVSSDMIAPDESMSRAALVTILDRAVVQYFNASGEYDLTDSNGIILVTAGDTILKGETKADILITQAADGKAVTFKDASVTGAVTVQADTKIINNNSKLPEIDATVEEVKKETPKKPSGGSSGGNYTPTISNLTISEEKAVTSGTYNNVTITDAVADGEVTLSNVTINGDLTIKGGGSSSVKLIDCSVSGKVIMAKESGEAPRLELTNTPVATVEVQKPAIIEAVDSASAVTKIEATANIEIKGENTKIDTLAVPETAESAVAVTVTAGNVATVEAKAETSVTGASNSVDTIVATAAVTADSEAVQKVEIPETATESVSVTVTGDATVDVEVNSTSGAAVTGTNVTVSTTLETAPDNITVGGTAVTHIHKWGEPVTTPATCDQDGENVYTCIADGCDDVAETKTEVITKLGHKYGDWKKSDDDLHVRECANDKDHYEKQDHTWDEGKVTTEPTCEQEGIKTFTCSVCKGTKTEPIPENGHVWGEWVKADATSHKRVCKTNASHIDTEDHTPIIDPEIEATCTETGKTEGSHCDICNSVIIEQTTTPALKHDFTGEYEKDADGHWHICERDNCEETDTKAGHTYNTTNCAEVATCTVCNYEKPAGEHTWSDWTKVDDTNHKRTCSCTATETAEHKWDDGKITTEPTETAEGVKTYTCSECKGTKTEAVPAIPEENEPTSIYTFNEEKGLRIKWTEATLSEGQSYYVTIKEPSSQYNCTSASFPVGGFTSKDNVVSGKISITVDVGTGWKETSALYEEKEIANITVNSTVPQFTIEKDDNGAYNFVSDANGGLWVYQVYNEEGLLTYSGNAINGAIDSYANFESGCKVVARYMTWSLSDDKDYAEITLTQQAEYTYKETASTDVKITLVQDGDSIKATWTGTTAPNYYFEIEDSSGKSISNGWTNGDECCIADLSLYLPRADADSNYTLVVYSANENWIVVEEIARLENCFEITVSGDTVEYDIVFNDGEDGVHSVTLTGITLPSGIRLLDAWYDSLGKVRGSGSSSISKNKTEHQAIQNGYAYDLRVLTAYALDGQTIKATMTPPSKKTYINENEPKIKWSDGGAIAWQAVANADDYKLNIYAGSIVDDAKLVATKNIGTYSTVYYIDSNFDLAELAENKDTTFTVELLALDANDNVIETVGVLANGINLTFTGTAPEFSFEVTGEKTYTITFSEGTPDGMRYVRWFDANNQLSGGKSGFGMTQLTHTYERAYAFAEGDTIKVYIATVDTITDTVWTITRTPDAMQTYTTEETAASLLSFRKWNTDIMFDGYDDVADTKSLEVNGVKVVSSKQETMSEFLFEYDQTKGNITDADFVVELDGVEKERISKNVDVTLSNTDVAFTINTDGTLSFDATTHGSFAYKTTKGGSGRIAFKNGTLVDGWTLPTLADGETIDIMHIDCTYDETTKAISATISKHTTKTYTALTTKDIWFSEDGDGIYVEWKEAELAEGEKYFITMRNPESLFTRTKAKLDLGTFFDESDLVNGKLSIKVDTGTSWSEVENLYDEKEFANVTLTNTTPVFTIEKDSTGKYKFVSDLSGGAWVYTTYDENDNLMYVGNVVDGAIDTYANFADGHTVKARYITWTLNEDKTFAEFTVSNLATYTYNEPVASDTNAHFMMEGDYLYLVFEDEEGLGADEWYYVVQDGENITSEDVKEIELTWLLPGISESKAISYEIQKGTWQTKETFVKLDNALNITVTDSAPNLSLVPQADGTYKITGGGDTGYFYRVTAPDGERLATDYTIDDTFLCSIYEGCTVELQTGTITVAADGLSADITMSPVVKIENPTLPTGLNTVVEVDTADELLDAVNRGAIATLTADITSENVFKFKTGAPATIDLNGHTLTAPNTRAYYGKELVIDATEEGSAIIGNVTVQLYGKLTLNGGTYSKIRVTDGRSFVANGITVESTDSSYALEIGYSDYIEINNSSCISTSTSDYATALYIWRSNDVNLNNVTASVTGNSFAADIAYCETVDINDGSFSAPNNAGLRFVDCEKAAIDGTSVSGKHYAVILQDGAVAEIKNGTFTSEGSYVIQLSRNNSSLTIDGGTFTANGDGSTKYIATMDTADNLAINGGTFSNVTAVTYSNITTAIVTGGTFSFDPTGYVDTTTHTVTDNGDGTFVVTAIKTE